MKIAVWLIAGTFALNALVLGMSVLMVTPGRHRTRREIRQLEALWRMSSSTSGLLRVRRLVALSSAAAIALAISALSIPGPESVTSAFGSDPVIFGDGSAYPDRVGVRASGTVATRAPVVDLAGASSASPAGDADEHASGSGVSDNQTTTPAFVEAQPRSSTVIRVSWAEVRSATGYDVERSTSGDAGWVTVAITRDGVTAYKDAGLNPEETYFYRVLVLLEDGAAAPPSDVVSATTLVDPPAPTVLRVTSRSRTTIDLAWDDLVDETSYRVERSTDGETGWTAIGTSGQDVTTYEDAGLAPETTYFYRVVATNEGGSSSPSNVVSETTKPGGAADGDMVLGGESPSGEETAEVDGGTQDVGSSLDPVTVGDTEPITEAEVAVVEPSTDVGVAEPSTELDG
ncbi:MAG: fibronectin type III domain-containing protein [Actinomycetota bacterium]